MLRTEIFNSKAFKNAIIYQPVQSHRVQLWSYGEVWKAIMEVQKVLEDHRLSGYYIGITLGHSPALIAIICGIHLSKSAFCCLNISNDYAVSYFNVFKRLSTGYCFCNKADIVRLSANEVKFKEIVNFDLIQTEIVLVKFEFGVTQTKVVHNIAYCVATSGSTGEPKLVRVPTNCILPNLVSSEKLFKIDESDRILVSCPPTFDPFIVDVFMALRNGACLILVANEIRLDTVRLRKMAFEHNRATFMQMTPSYLWQWGLDWIKNVLLARGSSLRCLVLGGEQFPSWLIIPANSTVDVYNIYGITEVSCWATIQLVRSVSKDEISIGSPIDDTIDLQLRDVDTGQILSLERRPVRGNLHIGSLVRKCVIGNEAAEDLIASDAICYRPTGDLVEMKSDGKFYYLGRCNDMVKRFGIRVNLGWLERCADKCSGISRSCVIFDHHRHKVVIFYTLDKNYTEKQQLKIFLKGKLKHEEMPDEYIEVDQLPLSDHGKTDRRKCFEMFLENKSINKTSKGLKQLFRDELHKLLGIRFSLNECDQSKRLKFDLTCSFIDAGGTSIQALHVVTSLQDYSGTTIPKLISLLLDKSVSIENIFEYLESFSMEGNSGSSKSHIDTQEPQRFQMEISIRTYFDMGKCIDASPTVWYCETLNKRVVAVGSHSHKVLVVEVENDSVVTEFILPDRVESPISYLIAKDLGFVGCYDGKLYCFSICSGSILWSFDSGGMIKSTSLVIDSVIVFGSYAEQNNLFALNLDGTLIWKAKLGIKGIFSSPISIGREITFVATLDGTFGCFSVRNGNEVWRGKVDSPIFANAVYLEKVDAVIMAEVQGRIHCLAAKCGSKIWCVSTEGNLFSSPCVVFENDTIDILIGCHDNHLYCFRSSDGKFSEDVGPCLTWRLCLQAAIYATPAVVDRLAVACTTSGWINLICLDSARTIGHLKLKGDVYSSPLVIGSNTVYVGCRDNMLYKLFLSKK